MLGQSPDSIPRELAVVLLGSFGGVGAVSLQVGRAHAGFPSELIPAGATVLGSLSRESQATTVLVFTQTESESRRLMRGVLEANGFLLAPMAQERRPGFVTTGLGSALSGQYCRGEDGMMLSTQPREGGGSFVRMVHVSGRLSSGWCGERGPLGASRATFMDSLPVPPLLPPDDFRVEGVGMGGASDDVRLTARLFGNGSSESVVRHYTAQLVLDGWMPTEHSHTSGAAFQLLRRLQDGKLAWSATLMAVGGINDGPMHVSLNLRRH